jgi:energy-coupling factor transporter ATP-binding protein EcfA2
MTEEASSERAGRPSIVQYFRIEGLHGYRTISLESDYAATLLIARNGSGKTTLLAALDAVLKSQFSRLRELRFTSIRCKLRNQPEELVLLSEDVDKYTANTSIDVEARRIEVDTSRLFLFLEEFGPNPHRSFRDDDVGQVILSKFGYDSSAAARHCDKLKQAIYDESPALRAASLALKGALEGVEVVYLPTYRRIELAVATATRQDQYGRVRKQAMPWQKSGLYSADIQFGLSDVVERLAQLNQRIVTDSSLGYRELSASIINELISGQFDRVDPSTEEKPDRDELELFFSRLKTDRTRRQFGPDFELSIPNIAQIYTQDSGGISQESNKFLLYFLGKLNRVIQSTRGIEALVRDFINNCNKYLSSFDLSTVVHGDMSFFDGDIDGKALTLSRRDLTISVESLGLHRKIPLNSLSSGEKQMISLFAKLYLYPKDKIILIDEPELSLSIDWQRQILVDIVEAPLCRQVVAITHSPFVFDNLLEPFARPLTSTIDAEGAVEAADDFEADNT